MRAEKIIIANEQTQYSQNLMPIITIMIRIIIKSRFWIINNDKTFCYNNYSKIL